MDITDLNDLNKFQQMLNQNNIYNWLNHENRNLNEFLIPYEYSENLLQYNTPLFQKQTQGNNYQGLYAGSQLQDQYQSPPVGKPAMQEENAHPIGIGMGEVAEQQSNNQQQQQQNQSQQEGEQLSVDNNNDNNPQNFHMNFANNIHNIEERGRQRCAQSLEESSLFQNNNKITKKNHMRHNSNYKRDLVGQFKDEDAMIQYQMDQTTTNELLNQNAQQATKTVDMMIRELQLQKQNQNKFMQMLDEKKQKQSRRRMGRVVTMNNSNRQQQQYEQQYNNDKFNSSSDIQNASFQQHNRFVGSGHSGNQIQNQLRKHRRLSVDVHIMLHKKKPTHKQFLYQQQNQNQNLNQIDSPLGVSGGGGGGGDGYEEQSDYRHHRLHLFGNEKPNYESEMEEKHIYHSAPMCLHETNIQTITERSGMPVEEESRRQSYAGHNLNHQSKQNIILENNQNQSLNLHHTNNSIAIAASNNKDIQNVPIQQEQFQGQDEIQQEKDNEFIEVDFEQLNDLEGLGNLVLKKQLQLESQAHLESMQQLNDDTLASNIDQANKDSNNANAIQNMEGQASQANDYVSKDFINEMPSNSQQNFQKSSCKARQRSHDKKQPGQSPHKLTYEARQLNRHQTFAFPYESQVFLNFYVPKFYKNWRFLDTFNAKRNHKSKLSMPNSAKNNRYSIKQNQKSYGNVTVYLFQTQAYVNLEIVNQQDTVFNIIIAILELLTRMPIELDVKKLCDCYDITQSYEENEFQNISTFYELRMLEDDIECMPDLNFEPMIPDRVFMTYNMPKVALVEVDKGFISEKIQKCEQHGKEEIKHHKQQQLNDISQKLSANQENPQMLVKVDIPSKHYSAYIKMPRQQQVKDAIAKVQKGLKININNKYLICQKKPKLQQNPLSIDKQFDSVLPTQYIEELVLNKKQIPKIYIIKKQFWDATKIVSHSQLRPPGEIRKMNSIKLGVDEEHPEPEIIEETHDVIMNLLTASNYEEFKILKLNVKNPQRRRRIIGIDQSKIQFSLFPNEDMIKQQQNQQENHGLIQTFVSKYLLCSAFQEHKSIIQIIKHPVIPIGSIIAVNVDGKKITIVKEQLSEQADSLETKENTFLVKNKKTAKYIQSKLNFLLAYEKEKLANNFSNC